MFDFFPSSDKKARAAAQRWLETAKAVWHLRGDRLSPADADELARSRSEVARLVAGRSAALEIKPAMQSLESVLRRTGGAVYPRGALAENVEFFLVAAIVILGIRSYFLQPMVIPTNSMWPTYYGMTAENFPPGASAPGLVQRIARLLAFGAFRKEVDAPESGVVSAPFVLDTTGQLHLFPRIVEGRSWMFVSAKYAEYTLYINDRPFTIQLPEDFDAFEETLLKTYFPPGHSLKEQWDEAQLEGRIKRSIATTDAGESYYVFRVPLGRPVQAGDPLIRFDLMEGDMLVVDRFSYHFFRPKVGTAFVFETGNIPALVQAGVPDEFYIKRLAGLPGDSLEIREPVLYRNGAPITGAAAFDQNARQEGLYRGYVNPPAGRGKYLLPGQTAAVPAGSFMGLGDNSPVSEDSRFWGFVPDTDVIGRPLFIYYPFTRRWGPAH